ncbi:hypothetical protein M409DRAFT_20460 [Zasmidium cellare ATCC 36951]|uniref:ATP-dependent RNA helicase n=1 Tax=Zasmidium cellare ATCC 36951 TaxID=1080233 RepID=A0A6A6CUS1_ZASCE|nr:uncharacterized protein M409DRAFT_20460 [Zasmidium cellare ATCC 36951]KAF2169236.1 hypothetical protein M409DRAFT_20460 [Zasmidium cellare ATCC 36951]
MSNGYARTTPSSGQTSQPQLFAAENAQTSTASRKRKRGQDKPDEDFGLDFFGGASTKSSKGLKAIEPSNEEASDDNDEELDDDKSKLVTTSANDMGSDESKSILKSHRLKITWLNPPVAHKKDRKKDRGKKLKSVKAEKHSLYPQPVQSFSQMRDRFGISSRLAANIEDQGYSTPTEVQLGALPLLLDAPDRFLSPDVQNEATKLSSRIDLLTVAPTGSGKTLAFIIPLLHTISQARRKRKDRNTSAIILAPTKELAGQIVNEGRKLARDTGIKITQVRKGMKLVAPANASDDEDEEVRESNETVVKSDILVSTPGILASAIQEATEQGLAALSAVESMILDEADVLLDPLFRDQTLAIWNSLSHEDLRVSLWSATMGSNIEELARSTLNARRTRISAEGGQAVIEAPLVRLVVGLKDSAVSNVQHRLVYAATENGKLMGLRQLLHPASTSGDSGPPLLPPFLVFTQTIQRAIALHSELLYDIPAEAGGISRIAVLHSDLSDTARDSVMTRFLKGEIWVLITTDLLSRGVDFRGVNGVVNYDIPTSSAAYVHRVGRTGRAGREGGIAVTLYSKEDIPYLKPIANLISTAHKMNDDPAAAGTQGVESWLLDALPSLSKKAKQDLKRRGVESRSSSGKQKDLKAARRTRISTKSGFLRKEEQKKKGAVRGSRNRKEASFADEGDETDFGGFD